eukprot:maker-scaffold_53-augustus-gene-1.19-mRNA-1 protein AED:1.00 eAED:1.00 QI:0/0/0/0.5/1/1/2/0/527
MKTAQNTAIDVELPGATPLSITSAEKVKSQLTWPIEVRENEIVQDVSVMLRGLFHPNAKLLKINILFADKQVHLTSPFLEKSTQGHIFGLDERAGLNYEFKDINGTNLALGKPAKAISSLQGNETDAFRGTDGDIFSSGFATKAQEFPWFEVDLEGYYNVRSVVLFTPDPDNPINEIQVLKITALITLAGSFKLAFGYKDQFEITDAISFDAPATFQEEGPETRGSSLQFKLQALSNIGLVDVTELNKDSEGAREWAITFLTDQENLPEIIVYSNNLTAGWLRADNEQVTTITVTTVQNGTTRSFYNEFMRIGSVVLSRFSFPEDFSFDNVENENQINLLKLHEEGFQVSSGQEQINVPIQRDDIIARYVRVGRVVHYVPNENFLGEDSFLFMIRDIHSSAKAVFQADRFGDFSVTHSDMNFISSDEVFYDPLLKSQRNLQKVGMVRIHVSKCRMRDQGVCAAGELQDNFQAVPSKVVIENNTMKQKNLMNYTERFSKLSFPPDKYENEGRFYNQPYCDAPPCNDIP